MKTRKSKMFTSVVLIICILMSVFCSSCDISSKHLEKHYDENDNENLHGWDDVDNGSVVNWDNANIQTFDETDEIIDWAYSSILFSEITDEYPVIDCVIMDYRSNGEYFDGELIYEMVNDEFDVNTFVSDYAVGTGVIVVCVVLHIATKGVSTAIIGSEAASTSPIVCFFAGAADASVSLAVKGLALNSAIEAVKTAILTNGDWDTVLYRSLEAGAQGYKWGAIFGAATGGWSSKYCFTEDTIVNTSNGPVKIKDISVGDSILSYDKESNCFANRTVTQVNVNDTDKLVRVTVGDETIESTVNHPYLTKGGWVIASELTAGDIVITQTGDQTITSVETIELEEQVKTYNLCVEDSHTYLVGNSGIVVHNDCKTPPNQQYAGRRVYFDDADWISDHPNKSPAEWKALAKKYPNGIYFKPVNSKGISYPDFSEYAEEIVDFDYPSKAARAADTCLNGNWTHDSKLADDRAGIDSAFREANSMTWNHNENMTSLELIPKDLHNAVAHSGGAALLRNFFKLI